MKKSKKPERRGGSQSQQIPLEQELEIRPLRPLVLEERTRLQAIFSDPVFRQAWTNAQAQKPSVVPVGLDGALGPQIGNNRLHQLQGWEMMKVALLRQAQEPRARITPVTDNYPDAGTIEADVRSRISK